MESGLLQRLTKALGISVDSDADGVVSAVQDLVSKHNARQVNSISPQKSTQETQESMETVTEQCMILQRRMYVLQKDNMVLKKALNRAQLASEPAIVQVKQLLLDPAMNKEFSALKSELESSHAEIRRLQAELDGLTFTQHSKAGRQLMAKCRKLQEENEEMGREISEGHVHELETQLTTLRNYNEELRKKFKELEAHCCALDEEAEDIQQQIFVLKQEDRPSRYRERSLTPRRLSPEYRDPPEIYDRRHFSASTERKRRLSEEHGTGSVPIRERSSGRDDERDPSYMRRRYKRDL